MRSNLNNLFQNMLSELKAMDEIKMDELLDEIMPEIRFEKRQTRAQMAREIIRGRLTSMLNAKGIYSYEKGMFVFIENANPSQLRYFIKKAKRDYKAAKRREVKAEKRIGQLTMRLNEKGEYDGIEIPEAIEL